MDYTDNVNATLTPMSLPSANSVVYSDNIANAEDEVVNTVVAADKVSTADKDTATDDATQQSSLTMVAVAATKTPEEIEEYVAKFTQLESLNNELIAIKSDVTKAVGLAGKVAAMCDIIAKLEEISQHQYALLVSMNNMFS